MKIRKVHDQLHDAGIQAEFLDKPQANAFVDRYFAMNFKDRIVSMTNFKVDDETVSMGGKRCKVYSLVDVDCAALPSLVRPYTNIEVNNAEMPVDLLSVIDSIPEAETVVYNQIIFLPNQKRELAALDKKKNRHASIPNPGNQMAVEDIKRVQEIVARESKMLVYSHFNLVVGVSADTDKLNIEKIDFLKNLILLIWKGSDTKITELEFRIVEQMVTDYYDAYFYGFDGYDPVQRENLHKTLIAAEKRKGRWNAENLPELEQKVDSKIRLLEERRKALKVNSLSFNTFYEYSCERLELICLENNITEIDYDKYTYMIQPFYKGGNYDKILNENVDTTLFSETFIVFEVDAIKENKKLFPIVTLIIMDVFLQKMRIKKNRKVLVIEEAWKAIASPLMAEYIKFMYKTARKFWASVGVVTQEIQDIIGSEIVKEAIINNSDVVMLLDQSKFKERFDSIKAILGLTDVDCKKIFTINRLENKEGRSFFREVFIRRGSTSGVYGVEEPHECYMTYTTERAEKEALKLYKKELRCSHQEAIEAYCRDWDASGISKSLPFAQKVNAAGHVLNLKKRDKNNQQ